MFSSDTVHSSCTDISVSGNLCISSPISRIGIVFVPHRSYTNIYISGNLRTFPKAEMFSFDTYIVILLFFWLWQYFTQFSDQELFSPYTPFAALIQPFPFKEIFLHFCHFPEVGSYFTISHAYNASDTYTTQNLCYYVTNISILRNLSTNTQKFDWTLIRSSDETIPF
jgi:hypothetical protein